MHYSIDPPKDEFAAKIFEATMKMLENDKEMRADRAQLVNVCCSPSAPVTISGRARVPEHDAA
jgi:hypothetical protein